MKITIAHNRTKAEVMQTIERSFDEMARANAGIPVQFAVKEKNWQGSVLNFELSAKMAMLSTPIKGTVEVTDTDVIVNADLGVLNRFVSDETAAEMFGKRFKGLLN
jgi:Putative polyhydroxyalkanoic acid system protein (PHA_gran_rgn)